MSVLMRLGVSLVMPLWGLIMLVLGLRDGSIWWIGCGAVVAAIGLLLFVGSPLAQPILGLRESFRGNPAPPKS